HGVRFFRSAATESVLRRARLAGLRPRPGRGASMQPASPTPPKTPLLAWRAPFGAGAARESGQQSERRHWAWRARPPSPTAPQLVLRLTGFAVQAGIDVRHWRARNRLRGARVAQPEAQALVHSR